MTASEHFRKLKSAKFAPRLCARAIWKSIPLKTQGAGTLLEVEVGEICTTPARENDLEVKTVKAPGAFCFSRGRRRDCDTWQNTWQAQEFVRVAKTLAGVVDLKRPRNNAFRVAGAMISCSGMSLLEASDAQAVEGLQISVTEALLSSDHFARQLQEFECPGSTSSWQATFEASAQKSWKRIGILRSSVWSTCHFWRKSRAKASFWSFKSWILKEVAEKLCFWASKLHFRQL